MHTHDAKLRNSNKFEGIIIACITTCFNEMSDISWN